MIWRGGISAYGTGNLHIWKGLNRFYGNVVQGRPCIFQQDKGEPHPASISEKKKTFKIQQRSRAARILYHSSWSVPRCLQMLIKEEGDTWTCPNIFETCCCHQTQDELIFFKWNSKMSHFQHFNWKYYFMRFESQWILFVFLQLVYILESVSEQSGRIMRVWNSKSLRLGI